jgi:hypothetical protein
MGDDGAAATAGEQLAAAEAEHADIAPGARLLPLHVTARDLAGVFDNRHAARSA